MTPANTVSSSMVTAKTDSSTSLLLGNVVEKYKETMQNCSWEWNLEYYLSDQFQKHISVSVSITWTPMYVGAVILEKKISTTIAQVYLEVHDCAMDT